MSSAVRYKNHKEDQMEIVNNAFVKIVSNISSYKPGTAYFSGLKPLYKEKLLMISESINVTMSFFLK